MNSNTRGFKTDSVTEGENLFDFNGVGPLKRQLEKIKQRVGLSKVVSAPTVTGNTDSQKITSLITQLTALGIIKNGTT